MPKKKNVFIGRIVPNKFAKNKAISGINAKIKNINAISSHIKEYSSFNLRFTTSVIIPTKIKIAMEISRIFNLSLILTRFYSFVLNITIIIESIILIT